MRDELIPNGDTETQEVVSKDVDADDPEASDLLDVIGRDSADATREEERPAPKVADTPSNSP
ncbi:MAG TPA: hypothetical protein VH681_13905, partial [Nitrospiraceae bacterium]